ncbi:MAG: MFS transporter, partial [Bacteroidetes bacterium]|nr:MFS transporter [Bacteroidota bacterium]
MKRKETILLLTLALIQFTHVMDFMIIMPLGNQLMKLFSIGPQKFGFIVSAYTITAGIVGFTGAFFVDNFDRKKILTVCYTGFLVGTLACAFAPNYEFMLLARILTGAFGGLLSTLILSIVGDAIPFERRASAMGVVTAGFSLASVFGVPFGNFLATTYTWHAPFFFIAGFGVLVNLLILRFVPLMNDHIQDKSRRPDLIGVIKRLSKNMNQRRALLLMSLLMLSQFSIIPFIAAFMEKNVGFSQLQVTYIYLFGGLCTVFTSPLIGRLADKIGKQKVYGIFAGLAIIPLFLITNMPVWPIWAVLVVTSFFFIVISGRVVPAMAMITSTAIPQNRGSFMSFNSSVQQLSAGIAAFISGAIVTENA